MSLKDIREHKLFRPAIGAALTAFCGLLIWAMPFGESWADASYDYLFSFGAHPVTNRVVIVFMDNRAYAELKQSREPGGWDRSYHAKLLNKLADGDCPLVVLDVTLTSARDPAVDQSLATAMRRLTNIVLAAKQAETQRSGSDAASPIPPLELFKEAARMNWGVAVVDNQPSNSIVRRLWPFGVAAPYPSLPPVAARLSGAQVSDEAVYRWLRYYGSGKGWTRLSYDIALGQEPDYFHDKVVFIGNKPETPQADKEADEFLTPYSRWTGETVGGVELLATTYLNLMNDDWLQRTPWPVEALLFILAGILTGGTLSLVNRALAFALAVGAVLIFLIAGVCTSYVTNYWFPWLILVGGQVPCALLWAVIPAGAWATKTLPDKTVVLKFPSEVPDAPEYELFTPPIGEGGFGKVWITRNAIGQWQALKAVYRAKFGDNEKPYEAEFNGLQKYKPVSEKHPGLLRIDLVSKMKSDGYFYYVMELGDAQTPGWEKEPSTYRPMDLENLRRQAKDRRLPISECVRIGTVLAEALDFLHGQGLTHRDIKPSNVIFVEGRPKLADVGLVTNLRSTDQANTLVGTLGYMPPPPESPGTAQADIYALGMLLYVISTGRDPERFPDISTMLLERSDYADFTRFNAVILKACQPDLSCRYQSTSEMLVDLRKASALAQPK